MEKLSYLSNLIVNIIKKLTLVLICAVVVFAILYAYYFSMDFAFKNILPSSSISVLSNFILFTAIILYVYFKVVKVPEKLQEAQEKVIDTVKQSENTKLKSEDNLSNIEKSISHIEEDIDKIILQSEKNAKLVGEKIIDGANKTALIVKDNAEKAIENSGELVKKDLLKRAALASVEVAKSHIIEELERNKDLHIKLIDESLNAIEGIEYNG